jgi:type II secretory pathway pseudopilin PulG
MGRKLSEVVRRTGGLPGGQAGTSLVEVLVSLAVFAVGVSAIAPMFLYSSTLQRVQEDTEIANELIMDEFERVSATPYMSLLASLNSRYDAKVTSSNPSIWFRDVDTAISEDQARIIIDLDLGHDDVNTWELGDDPLDFNMTRITVSAEWRSLGRTQRVSLARVRMRS